MDDQLRSFLANLSNERTAEPKPAEHMADEEVQQALAICNGDAVAALRITLIANAFLEAQVEELKAQISAASQRKRNPARTKVSETPTRAKKSTRAAKA
jgi:hypothetical protein